jgi:hypothetical protein
MPARSWKGRAAGRDERNDTLSDAAAMRFVRRAPSTRRGDRRPWTVAMPMTSLAGGIFEYACHEGKYGLMNILSGHRAQENVGK